MPRRKPRPQEPPTRRRNKGPAPLSSIEEIAERVKGPVSGQVEGFVVMRSVKADRRYRCPYCEGWIEPNVPHVVAYPVDRLDDRRHYHSACWSRHASSLRSGRG